MSARIMTAAAVAVLVVVGEAVPTVLWHSGDVKKGEHVLVAGCDWGQSPVVDVGGRRVKPDLVTPGGVFFSYPLDGAATCQIVGSDGTPSAPFVVNEPEIWFVKGDEHDFSTPGGDLRIYGRNLVPGVEVSLGGRRIEAKSDGYSIEAKIPAGFPLGNHDLMVAGKAFPIGWTVAAPRRIWKSDIFNITKYGAEANHGRECGPAVRAALKAAAANGGGTVYVPCGRFQVSGTLDIPPHVLLRGESMEKSCLYWRDTLTPPHAFIRGAHSFGIHELMVHSGKFKNGIVVTNSVCPDGNAPNFGATMAYPSHDISLRRVHMRFIVDQHQGARSVAERALGEGIHGRALTAYGVERFAMEDCSIYALKQDFVYTWGFGSKHVIRGRGVRIANCIFDQCTWGTFSGRNVEIVGCTFRGSNVGISPDTKGLYYGHNRNETRWENDREALTHDQICNAFNEQVKAKVNGTEVELIAYGTDVESAVKSGKMKFMGKAGDWVGRELIVSSGRGVSQKRRIVKMHDRGRMTINRPFAIPTDATSRFTIGALRDRLIYVDNSMEDASVAIQLYGSTWRGVVARNKSTRAGGFLATGGFYSTTPVWFVDMNDNLIDAGMSYWYPSTKSVIPHCSRIGTDMWYATDARRTDLTRWLSIKRNRVLSNGMIDVLSMDTLVEGNYVADSEFGVVSKGAPARQLVCGNVFERVGTKYADFSKGVPERVASKPAAESQKTRYKPSEICVQDVSYVFMDTYGNPPLGRDWATTRVPADRFAKKGPPYIQMDGFKSNWAKANSVVLETFLNVKDAVTLSFSRFDEGSELYLDGTLIQSGDARSNSRTIPRTIQPGVHRLRLFRSKFAPMSEKKTPEVLGIKVYNYGAPEDSYVISHMRPRK